ncbi:hypothetical protein F511_45636 [Dorcoceras hygrometricum]|uniref:Uncharacterized protein n=1 Tax=Dorcoceras hygrometricum TaxID=472368 RepID=A0A2Z6ZWN6_9LAMI|nr:hypothetical protein F511_45636 [Dorcoceras hygrometricum]
MADAGRTLAVRRADEARNRWPDDDAWRRRLVERCWSRTRDVVRVPPRFFFRGGAAAGRPPLRRRSGDVMTAGLNSSRVLVRACPGQPVKFSGRFSGKTSEDGGDDNQDIEDRRSVKPQSIVIGLHCILHYP